MFQKYISEEKIYLITNKVVARTSIFGGRHYCERFLYQMRRYVGPLGQILGYALIEDEFCFVIRLKTRKAFVEYFAKRQLHEGKDCTKIPDSTYIFSQAMSNLQNSTAKHYNFREDRSGTLFAARFKKKKIRDETELRLVYKQLFNAIQVKTYRSKWRDARFDRSMERKSWAYNFKGLMDELSVQLLSARLMGSSGFMMMEELMGQFESILRGRLRKSYFFTKIPFNLPFLIPNNPP